MGVRKANRMVNSCALCGLCTAVCPENFSMADVCLDARQSMVRTGKMPPSAHDFALRDMAFSQSEAFTLARPQPGFQSSKTAFLPGCQLSASSPGHVAACYEHLRATMPGGVGLILECCGAPARWAGNEEKFQEALRALGAAWSSLGQPRLITACSSCFRTLKDHLPHIPVEPLWPHLSPALLSKALPEHASRTLAIHDPCSTRGVSMVEGSARALLGELGGMGCGKTCGALTGGCCLLGLYAGKDSSENNADDRLQGMLSRFVEWFETEYTARYGGIDCAEIVGDDMRNRMARCPGIVMESLKKLGEILAENNYEFSNPTRSA
jgi:ferredoxin